MDEGLPTEFSRISLSLSTSSGKGGDVAGHTRLNPIRVAGLDASGYTSDPVRGVRAESFRLTKENTLSIGAGAVNAFRDR